MNITVSPFEARDIVKDAYIYGWPLSENYNILNSYALDGNNSEFKAPFNEIRNLARVYGPNDKAVVTPNSDTPYSFTWMDLRAEPVAITIPSIPEVGVNERYFSFQLIDLYTFNYDYIGTRMEDLEAGDFLIVGPSWKGPDPSDEGFKRVFHAETEFVFAITRTQLLNDEDLEHVKAIQAQFNVQTLSQFRGIGAPPSSPAIAWPETLFLEEGETPAVFRNINFLLQFCPTHPSEERMMQRFAQIGVGAGLPFDPDALSPEMAQAFEDGIADAWKEFEEVNQKVGSGELTTGDLFGTREFLITEENPAEGYLHRFSGAKIGLYGNSEEEALYPMYYNGEDADGNQVELDASQYKYEITLPEEMPVDAFWSVTMYDDEQYLVANEINRYLVNSSMQDSGDLTVVDGSITIYIQKDQPEDAAERKNWLPTPDGLFFMAMRLYIPRPEALDGTWQVPPVIRTEAL